MSTVSDTGDGPLDVGRKRRDFLFVAAGVAATVGTAFAVWPLIDSMNPAADVLSLATTDVDLAPIQVGQRITVV